MNNEKIITSFSFIKVAEGWRCTYTYSIINTESGDILSNNERASFVVLGNQKLLNNTNILTNIGDLEAFIQDRENLKKQTMV